MSLKKRRQDWTCTEIQQRVQHLNQAVDALERHAAALAEELGPPLPDLRDLLRQDVPLRLRTEAADSAQRLRGYLSQHCAQLCGVSAELTRILETAEERTIRWGAA